MFQISAISRDMEKQGRRVLHFELGDPDFNTPDLVTEACIQSLRIGNTHYIDSRGSDDLIEAVRMTTGISRGFIPNKSQITITTGANSAIFYAFKAVCDAGDEVLLPNPFFPSYIAALEIAGARPKYYDLFSADNFVPRLDTIESLLSPSTKAIVLNSPSNPTGTVLPPDTIRHIYDLAVANDIYVISDEVYARMIFDLDSLFFSPGSIDACKERSIIINGFSKAFAMTGWRVGVVIAPEEVSSIITLLSESIVSCVPGFIQDAARAAILCPNNTTKLMYTTYRSRQLEICKQLCEAGLDIKNPPNGAMYVFPNISRYAKDSEAFAFHLLRESGIATVPGKYFGSNGEAHLRFSCAGSDADIQDLGAYFYNAAISYSGN